MTPSPDPQPIVVVHDGGQRFIAQVRPHQVIMDQPRHAGGADTGPMPTELLGVSLGTCIALYVTRFLEARDLPREGMRVEVEQVSAKNPSRVSHFVARVVLPAPLPPGYGEMLEHVVHACPAHNTLAQGSKVQVFIDIPAATTVLPGCS